MKFSLLTWFKKNESKIQNENLMHNTVCLVNVIKVKVPMFRVTPMPLFSSLLLLHAMHASSFSQEAWDGPGD